MLSDLFRIYKALQGLGQGLKPEQPLAPLDCFLAINQHIGNPESWHDTFAESYLPKTHASRNVNNEQTGHQRRKARQDSQEMPPLTDHGVGI